MKCTICNGTSEYGVEPKIGMHHICNARAKRGLPTPPINKCPICNDTQVKPGVKFNGVMFFANGSSPAAMARWAKAVGCPACVKTN